MSMLECGHPMRSKTYSATRRHGRAAVCSRLSCPQRTLEKLSEKDLDKDTSEKEPEEDLPEKIEEDELEEVKERFFREAESAGRLNHPNIVTIYDVGEENDLAYIAMEYIEGEPIDRYADARRLDVNARLRLFVEVADAVADRLRQPRGALPPGAGRVAP